MDAVLYWNDVALEANRVSHTVPGGEQTGPPLSARALAIVHLAIYDAFAGVTADPVNLPPYLTLPAAPPIALADAAVAAAAHTTLSALYPSQRAAFDTKLATAGLAGTGPVLRASRMYGISVAQAMLADRGSDPGVGSLGYVHSATPGHDRDDPDNPGVRSPHAPFYGAASKCFAVTKRWALDKSPLPGDVDYLKALRQVRGKGIAPELTGTVPSGIAKRTVDETIIGLFWAYDGAKGLGTPPRLYNQILRQLAVHKANTVAQNARLFALANVAMADAGILAWEQKYAADHDVWRPVVGIREHDPSMGAGGVPTNDVSNDCDPGWLPLGAPSTNKAGEKNFTPPFPAYPSGHATFGAAAFEVARRFYGVTTDGPDSLGVGLEVVSEELNGVNTDNKGTIRPRHVRDFPDGLWGMIMENSISRVYLGVHWVFDGFAPGPNNTMDLTQNVGGVALGLNIARDIFNTKLKKSNV